MGGAKLGKLYPLGAMRSTTPSLAIVFFSLGLTNSRISFIIKSV
jgi:hypothetical protein